MNIFSCRNFFLENPTKLKRKIEISTKYFKRKNVKLTKLKSILVLMHFLIHDSGLIFS